MFRDLLQYRNFIRFCQMALYCYHGCVVMLSVDFHLVSSPETVARPGSWVYLKEYHNKDLETTATEKAMTPRTETGLKQLPLLLDPWISFNHPTD